MTDKMNLTEACRIAFDYFEGGWTSQEHANRALAWAKEVGLKLSLDRIGSKQRISPATYYILRIKDDLGTIFHPDDASFETWRKYTIELGEKQWTREMTEKQAQQRRA